MDESISWYTKRVQTRFQSPGHSVNSSRSLGRVGVVGAVDVDVETGELNLSDELILLLADNAQRLAAGAAL